LQEEIDKIKAEEQQLAQEVDRRKISDEQVRAAVAILEAEKESLTAQTKANAAILKQAYGHLVKGAQEFLDEGDFVRLGELVNVWPPKYRRWEWRYLKSLVSSPKSSHAWILYSIWKEPRRKSEDGVPPTLANGDYYVRWDVHSHDGQTIPDWDEDPDWANLPPSLLNCYLTDGIPQIASPSGNVLVTTETGKRLSFWDISTNAEPILIASCRPPFGKVTAPEVAPANARAARAAAKQHKQQPVVGLAFSRDGKRLAQLSLDPDDLYPSPIRLFDVPMKKAVTTWQAWTPPVTGREALAAEIAGRGGGPSGLIGLFNAGTQVESSQLLNGEEMSTSAEGLSAGFNERGLRLQIADRQTKYGMMFESGLDPRNFLRRWSLSPSACQYFIMYRGCSWSADGTRLLIQAHVESTYFWGFQGIMTRRARSPGSPQENIPYLDRASVTMLCSHPTSISASESI